MTATNFEDELSKIFMKYTYNKTYDRHDLPIAPADIGDIYKDILAAFAAHDQKVRAEVIEEAVTAMEAEIANKFREADGKPRCEIVCKYARGAIRSLAAPAASKPEAGKTIAGDTMRETNRG